SAVAGAEGASARGPRPAGRDKLTPEEQAKRREEFMKLTPEEREARRAQRRQAAGGGAGAGQSTQQ
ncbi:MAG: hypothetical protein JWQ76_5005, partial [Ramlibacter sp.]|nr:hypothetical protein [Ramlibacter sp.]